MDTSTNSKPTVSSTETSNPPKTENGWSTFLKKWVLFRLFAALAWSWLILTLIGKEVSFGGPLNRNYLALPFLIAWIGFVIAHKWGRVLFYFPYVVFFPILILVTVGWWIFQFFRKTLKWPIRVLRAIKSGTTIFIVFVGILISWIVTLVSASPTNRAIASLIALAGTYLLVLQSFRWASNPYRPLLAVIEFLSEKGSKAFEEAYVKPGMTDQNRKRDTAIEACDWCLKALDKLYQAKAPLSHGVAAFTHRSLLPSFVFGFIALYAILASSFSVALFHIERAWGSVVEGIGNPPTLFSYFYFSFLSQATAVPDGIRPLSVYGQIWILWVVMTGILLLTLLIALFTTSVGVHGDNALLEVRTFSEHARRDLNTWRGQLSQPIIETEVVDVEEKVVETAVEVRPTNNEENSNAEG